MKKRIYYNPLKTACKNVTGAICQGEYVRFNIFNIDERSAFSTEQTIRLPEISDCVTPCERAFLQINRDEKAVEVFEMQKTTFGWTISFRVNEIGLYYYTFYIEKNGYISRGKSELGVLSDYARGFLLTVYAKDYVTPEWFKGGVMYQIFPDRFYKYGTTPDIKKGTLRTDWGGTPTYQPNKQGKILNNDFFGGNLKGIQAKLPYLQKLGITVIYLNPIFEAASNHRYDTSDYLKIDPILGDENDFNELVDSAESYGIRLILDGVFNHTGDDSVYFNKYGNYPSVGAFQSKDSPYYSWYTFTEYPNRYESWWGIDILPEINENSEAYQDFVMGKNGVLEKWLAFGIGGYRLDVADELPDFFLKKLRKTVKQSNADAVIIGEVWEDASDKIAYDTRREYLQGYELDSVMNYPLKDAIIQYIQSGKASVLLQTIHMLTDHYPKQTLDCLMNILGTHDTARILTVLGGVTCKNKDEMASPNAFLAAEQKEDAIEKLKMAVVLQYTLPGVPCLYYGDENAAEGHIDPFCRRCFDWEHLRTDLIEFYARLGNIRSEYRAIFRDGKFIELHAEDGLIFYKRENQNGTIYVYVNRSEKAYQLHLRDDYRNLLTDEKLENLWTIQPNSFCIFTH